MTPFPAHLEQFDRVGSTNDVVRDWLAAGHQEVCLAVAREQTAGRGRSGRTWIAPPDAALLLSLGFRPTWLAPDRAWQLAAIVSLAMADAADAIAGLAGGTIRLKWPNDLVVDGEDGLPRKLGGVLGETDGLGTADPRVVVGIGLNADWPETDFPPDLAGSITSLRALAGSPSFDATQLLAVFIDRLGVGYAALRAGSFDGAAWAGRQLTTGRTIRLETADGTEEVRALGVDASSGALMIADPKARGGERRVMVGEVTRVRLAAPTPARV